jgi:hypothetical protein
MQEKSGVNTLLLVVILLIIVAGAVWWYNTYRVEAEPSPQNGVELEIGYDSNQSE